MTLPFSLGVCVLNIGFLSLFSFVITIRAQASADEYSSVSTTGPRVPRYGESVDWWEVRKSSGRALTSFSTRRLIILSASSRASVYAGRKSIARSRPCPKEPTKPDEL